MLSWVRERIKRYVSMLHVRVYRLTGGRIGGSLLGRPFLLLTSTGRKSGQPRTWPLLYLHEGSCYVLIASNWGQDHHPAWLLNLRANPRATVQVGSGKIAVTAHEATGEERERYWRKAVDTYAGYDRYQSRTGREIRVVLLEPVSV